MGHLVALRHATTQSGCAARSCGCSVCDAMIGDVAVQITRHVRNTETQGIDVQLESIINRWGMKTISALCELHDEAHGRSRADLVCAHALRLS